MVGLLAAPAAVADSTVCASDYDITIEELLLNPNGGWSPSEATVTLTTPIPAGEYSLAMVSFDDHSNKAVDQSDQVNEQWVMQLLDAQGAVVFQSGVSPDLPDDQDWLTFNSAATLTGDAVTMRVAHAAIGTNVNSIVASCAGFTPVPPPVGSIGDTVWLDTDGNGLLDGAEAGIAGVLVGLGGPVVGSTTTDANGAYSFGDLPAGIYVVTVGAGPTGTELTTVGSFTVDLAEDEDFVDADFGFSPVIVEPELGLIGDTVWLDTDANGLLDGSESGIPGITVTLDGPVSAEATTTTDGTYGFGDLPAGAYIVTVSAGPAGTELTTVGSFAVDLAEGEDFVDADFGFTPVIVDPELGSIGDMVWLDANGNGWREGDEFGIAGVRVLLSTPGTPGAIETVTDATGHYLFADLPSGNYDVTVDVTTAPTNTALTTPGATTVSLAAGENYPDADFGFAGGSVLATAAIGDQVWMDDDLDGIFDAGESVLAGVTLSLFDPISGTTKTAVSSASGQYLFAALTPGTYEVSVVTTTAPESTSLTTVGTYAITLGEGQTSLIADFGFAQALPATGFETADFGIAGLVLLLIGAAALVLVR
ncbi:MAG: LPXTG cell wall anchor domain-containing protein, partial [Acidimicrobiia bacterium]|nr:LPXTG cell wall anchor domain-containing protein [Acidimicrobiia bacterium]